MSLRSKLKIENVGLFAAAVFYAAVGIISFIVLSSDIGLIHIGIIGIFSLITAYGLLRRRVWSIWFVATLFLVATTVSAYTLYLLAGRDPTLDVSMIFYFVLTWVFTAYVAVKRKALET
jgi:hypothetical protein